MLTKKDRFQVEEYSTFLVLKE